MEETKGRYKGLPRNGLVSVPIARFSIRHFWYLVWISILLEFLYTSFSLFRASATHRLSNSYRWRIVWNCPYLSDMEDSVESLQSSGSS